MKVRIPFPGTIGKAVKFDPSAGARAEAAVAALQAQINAGLGSAINHSALRGLQVGDDHPQYTMWQAPETIQGQWNFQTIPYIQGDTLAEYIEDVVGGSFFDFLQDTTSVVWTYHETANELEANVPPEFVQDTVGAMVVDSTSVDFTYNDVAGTLSAAVIDEYVQDLVGAMLVDSSRIDFTYSDPAGTITADLIANSVSDTYLRQGAATSVIGRSAGTTGNVADIAAAADDRVLARTGGALSFAQLTVGMAPNSVWTYAKIQNVSATNRLLGRISSGAGVIEELTGANLMTILSAAGLGPANPSAVVGLSAVIGSATTYMPSDAAPALNQGITPTWTSYHDFTYAWVAGAGVPPAIRLSSNLPAMEWRRANAAADAKRWIWLVGGSGNLDLSARNDADDNSNPALRITRSGFTPLAMQLLLDNYELQLGAGNDLRFYHDGTDSLIRNDTGDLRLNISTNTRLRVHSDGRISGTALHNVGTVTGTTNQFIASGTYTPTLTNVTNVAASTARQCQWLRVGNVVTVSGQFDVDPTAAGATELGVSLPIASALTTAFQLGGTANSNVAAGEEAMVDADATNDRARVRWVAVDATNHTYGFIFSYEVL